MAARRAKRSDYRPISLLSVVSKLLEKLIHSRISEHLAEHAPISDTQWGFQKGKYTVCTAYSLVCRKRLTLSLTDG